MTKASVKTNLMPAVLIATAIVLLALVYLLKPIQQVFGSTSRGSEYQATTTVAATFQKDILLQNYPGTLGSITITGAAAGTINIYDATTSNVNLRTGQIASTSILLATVPVSAAAGTYTFDEIAQRGIYIDIVGTIPTSTVTFR